MNILIFQCTSELTTSDKYTMIFQTEALKLISASLIVTIKCYRMSRSSRTSDRLFIEIFTVP
jgi:hypothetical protein